MKKLLLLLMSFVIFSASDAQVIFYEDFDGVPGPTAGGAGTYTFPSGWLLRNVDNRTPNAQVGYVNEAWERREDFASNVSDSMAFSTSYYSPVGVANDWMWTPAIGPIPANASLSWFAKAYDAQFPDGYEVRIMKSPDVPTGGTGVIGNQITSSTVVYSTGAELSTGITRTFALSDYVGETIYIGFRNNSNDKFILVIDDVKVESVVLHDAQMVSTVRPTNYSFSPLPQVQEHIISGTIKNAGLNALTNVKLNARIFNEYSQQVYEDTSSSRTLLPNESALFNVPSFLPSVVGNYTIEYSILHNENDDNLLNDTLYSSFSITDSTYARDNGTMDASLGIGAGTVGYMGLDYEVINKEDLTSIRVYFARGYTNRKVAVVIWDMLGGKPSTIVASTDTILYMDDSARAYNLNIYGGPVSLNPGRYAITAVEFDSVLALGMSKDLFTTGTTWVKWPTIPGGDWANMELFGISFARSPMIRPNFGVYCNLISSVDSIRKPSCYDSNDGWIALASQGGNGGNTYEWTPNVSDSSSASGLPAGLYSIKVTDSKGCVSVVEAVVPEADTLDVRTSLSGSTLTATATGMEYKWINCNGNTPVQGATSQNFTPTQSGSYAVVISDGVCIDTSACVNVTIVGIEEISKNIFSAYPNPNSGSFMVKSENSEGTYTIYNSLGQVVRNFSLNFKNNYTFHIEGLTIGTYMISGSSEGMSVNQKLVVIK